MNTIQTVKRKSRKSRKTKEVLKAWRINQVMLCWYLAGQQSHHQKMCLDPRRLWAQHPGSPEGTSHSGSGGLCCRSESTWKWGETLLRWNGSSQMCYWTAKIMLWLTCSLSWRDSCTWGSRTAQSCAPWTGLAPRSALKTATSAGSEQWQKPGGRRHGTQRFDTSVL